MNLTQGITWGYPVNGSFNGILGDMIKGIVDVAVSPYQFKIESMDVMEFTVQAWVARYVIYFGNIIMFLICSSCEAII